MFFFCEPQVKTHRKRRFSMWVLQRNLERCGCGNREISAANRDVSLSVGKKRWNLTNYAFIVVCLSSSKRKHHI